MGEDPPSARRRILARLIHKDVKREKNAKGWIPADKNNLWDSRTSPSGKRREEISKESANLLPSRRVRGEKERGIAS